MAFKEGSTGNLFGMENFKGKGCKPPLVEMPEPPKEKKASLEKENQESTDVDSKDDERWQKGQDAIKSIRDNMDSIDPGPSASAELRRRHLDWQKRQEIKEDGKN